MHIPSSGARYLGMLVLVLLNPGVNGQTTIDEVPAVAASIPAPTHVIVVMEENHGYAEIIGSGQAPYINTLATQSALFTNSFAITHPSQPNYLALFSGSKRGIIDDSCPHIFTGRSLESMLLADGKTFKGYSEGLPGVGSQVCSYGKYARKHAPWTDFSRDLASDNQPFSNVPTDFSKLPTVSSDLDNDMHDGTI